MAMKITSGEPLTEAQKAEFQARVQAYVDGAQKIVDKNLEGYSAVLQEKLVVEDATRYVRIYAVGTQRRIHTFIDKTNGDVLKPASWKAPAKHARGNIFDEKNGLGSVTAYGPAYLR